MANYNVDNLATYVEQNRNELLNKLIFEGDTISRMHKQVGVKTKATINTLDTDPVFQDGKECGYNAEGTATLSQREISTGIIKVNMDICPKSLLGTYAEYLVRMSAVEEGDRLPFEQEFTANLVNKIKTGLEKAVWQGDTASDDATLKHFDGLLKIAGAESEVVKVSASAVSTPDAAYEAVQKMYLAIPEETIDDKACIFVSPSVFRLFMVKLVQANLYHYSGAQNEDVREFIFPGTNVRVVSAKGLSGTNKMLAASENNLYYGTDREGDAEVLKLWFSDDDDVFKCKVQWNSGVQFAFPDRVVLGTIA
jgi:hypothetical protein